jgi:glutamyl-tRNA reductase
MSEPHLFVIGATHHNAPLAVRERLAVASEGDLRADLAGVESIREFLVLNTCNRVEFYVVGSDASVADRVQAAYCARQRFAVEEFERIRIRLSGQAAAQHIFEVASGVDSQLVGENEIFGQVKQAYAVAQASGTAGAVLNRVFQKAFQAAKHVRTHTGIAAGTVSIANVAVELAADIFGSLAGAKVLVLGTGEIGGMTAKAFASRGAEDLAVAGRRTEKAQAIATGLGADVLAFAERESRLAEYDVVVSSTAATETILSAAAIAGAMRRRPARPLLLIDLAVPRDIDVAAAGLENVFLYNHDDQAGIAEKNRAAREAEIVRCRTILAERAEVLWAHLSRQSPGQPPPRPDPTGEPGHASS